MLSRTPVRAPTPEAIEFVRFCYRRRRLGWPELYDEMCAVAGRGLFRGWNVARLDEEGIGFGLFDLPPLAEIVRRIVDEERSHSTAMDGVAVGPGRNAPAHPPSMAAPGAAENRPRPTIDGDVGVSRVPESAPAPA